MMPAEPVVLTRYDILKGVRHGFTSRSGGVSPGACASLNMSFSREPSSANVKENYRRVSEAAGVDPGKMTRVPQLHTAHVLNVTQDMAGMGITAPFPEGMEQYGYDAMITNVPGIVLCTVHADCVPVLLYDSGAGAIGAVHSGWRGTARKISACAVSAMKHELGAEPARMKAVIGPSICAEHFETDSDVYDAMKESFGSAADEGELVYRANGKFHISVSGFVYRTLTEAGLRPENIYTDTRCTYECEDMFYSHRRDKGRTGAMAALIALE